MSQMTTTIHTLEEMCTLVLVAGREAEGEGEEPSWRSEMAVVVAVVVHLSDLQILAGCLASTQRSSALGS